MEYGEGFRRMMFARRKRKGMTQTELGAEVGISQHGISDYECGKTSIPIDDAAAIAAVLEFSLDEATKLTKREGALYPSADEWELIDLFREIPEKNRREVIEIVRLTKKMVNGKKIWVCQEKCVSFFVSFFTSVNLFCYLQIYHHHF